MTQLKGVAGKSVPEPVDTVSEVPDTAGDGAVWTSVLTKLACESNAMLVYVVNC